LPVLSRRRVENLASHRETRPRRSLRPVARGHADPGAPVDPEQPAGSIIVLWMTGINALQAELLAKQYRYARPSVEPTPRGARMMEIADPFGNRLRFMAREQTIEA
jgi:Glyoxalase superfamily protein